QLPACVQLVQPHITADRCNWPLVEATLAALRLLYHCEEKPDWFAILSGSDYPVKPAGTVIQELTECDFDAFMDCQLIDPKTAQTMYQRRCAWRYFRQHFELPYWVQRHMPFVEPRAFPLWLVRPTTPFSPAFQCYAGSQWFTGTRRCAQY